MRTFVIAALSAALAATAAPAATIDFNSLTVGQNIAGVDLGGVVITRGGEAVEVTSDSPGNSGNTIRGSVANNTFTSDNPFRADFTSPVSFVSVQLGDFGADEDNLFLRAFGANDTFLAATSAVLGARVQNMLTLALSASGIRYVLFGSSGDFNNSVYADNLTFTNDSVPPIPLPAGAVLLLTALGGLAWAGRRAARTA